ncbi:MAG: Fn3-like domain-containing protein [Acidobacteria bacterium]|nr:Fn3-like domain-containing protein [Acidobacteriota bacterium]MBV9068274.1 Fn3-like domain-containing protein [Acidobacteriota bacterium]MBV9185044.1 Fn3-like domain-containing protein [Acidobacteriota bacterium]
MILLTLASLPAFAASGSLSVSPAVVMLQGTPGQSTTQTLTIVNSSDQPFSFDLKAEDAVARNGNRVYVKAGELAGSIAATAVFSRKSVTVAPGERTNVTITVTIPPKPASRAIIALFHGTTRMKSAGMNATASLGTLMTFALSDNATATATPLSVRPPSRTANLSVSQQLVNSGSEPVLARGVLAIINPGGTLVAKQALPARRVLPGETFAVNAEYGGELAAGHYRAFVTYDLQNSKSITSSAEFDVR